MRNMSFALTTDQVRSQIKSVTRRFGWRFLKPGDLVQPILKGMGLKKGEKIEKIGCPIRILSTRWERLDAMTAEECTLEGFPGMSPEEFVNTKLGGDGSRMVNRIEFEYTEPLTVEAV